MKVLLLNSSTHKNGCTALALNRIAKVLKAEGVDSELWWLGTEPVRDCAACNACSRLSKCAFDDGKVNEFTALARVCDGFVFGTPVYYAHPTGRILSFLDRAFYSATDAFRQKPGAAIASARRAGTTASLDVLNKYFTIAQMPVISSTYWNMVHGRDASDAEQDLEGLQTMENLARNMAWILKSIEAGKIAGIEKPDNPKKIFTNFIS